MTAHRLPDGDNARSSATLRQIWPPGHLASPLTSQPGVQNSSKVCAGASSSATEDRPDLRGCNIVTTPLRGVHGFGPTLSLNSRS